MAEILSDKQIVNLIDKVIINGAKELIGPNSIELRLGAKVYFHSTEEELEMAEGNFLKINPGETVTISSYEKLDLSKETVAEIFANETLMGFITPTTTMMREGILNVSTKTDVGYKGILNWTLRSGSSKEIILKFKEPIFKLTLFKLKGDENPEVAYGERENDKYQDTDGINYSKRTIPSAIPKNKVVQSSFGKIDPKKELKEAGYPFSFIGTELTQLHGRLEVVSTDMRLVKDEFDKKTNELSKKIEKETESLTKKIDTTEKTLLEKFDLLFSKQFLKIVGILIGAGGMLYGVTTFLQSSKVDSKTIAFI
ncbi:MAG TPA: hypothetical protein VKB95_16600, partial [Chitinophagaceae bacterium]|nr:hypothetical protein [Chitinophagaceae bacterium]